MNQGTEKAVEKISETESCFFGKINKIDIFRLTKRKREDTDF